MLVTNLMNSRFRQYLSIYFTEMPLYIHLKYANDIVYLKEISLEITILSFKRCFIPIVFTHYTLTFNAIH